jgi:NADH:ubiquinone oxidoreductase subunit F (NADH-binding)
MSEQPQLLYKNRYVEGIASIDTWIEHGGYESFRKALTMTPEAIIDEIKTSGLRGGAGQASRPILNGARSPRISISRTIW